jgi:DNA-binding response OmpR family regulator
MAKVLVADDNRQIVSVITEYLKNDGHEVHMAYDGLRALSLFEEVKPDAVLLDVMMPGLDGFSVCRKIRQTSQVPVIMVTARGEDYEKIMGLDTGADDYLVKPFSPAELMARLRAVLRRTKPDREHAKTVRLGNLEVDLSAYTAHVGQTEVALTRKEIELLHTFLSYPGKVFTRENLLESLWGYEYDGDARTVDTHIKRLRAKLETFPQEGWCIRTIRGVGYKMEEHSK